MDKPDFKCKNLVIETGVILIHTNLSRFGLKFKVILTLFDF